MASDLVSFRADDDLKQFLDDISDEWGITKSETIRRLIRMQMGLLEGRFLSLLDKQLLIDNWGDLGVILKGLKESEDVSSKVLDARLKDVVEPRILLGAEEVEVRGEESE